MPEVQKLYEKYRNDPEVAILTIIEPAAKQLTLNHQGTGRIHGTSAIQRFGACQMQ